MGGNKEAKSRNVTSSPVPTMEKFNENKKPSLELIERAVNLILDNRYAFFYLIESIFPINSEEDGLRETKLIERSLNYMRTRDNRRVVSHFIMHRVTTRLELSKTLGIKESSISYKLKDLKELGLIEKKGRVQTRATQRKRGPGIPLWGLLEAEPQDYVEAQKRYGEILLATGDASPGRQCQLSEAVALSKIYMEDRGLKTIPERVILDPMLKNQGINVDHDQLLTALVKEGYIL